MTLAFEVGGIARSNLVRAPRGDCGIWANDALVAELKRLQADRCSAGYIAQALSRQFGVSLTRNAIIGKLHRIGLRPQSTVLTDAERQKRAEARRAKHRDYRMQRIAMGWSPTPRAIIHPNDEPNDDLTPDPSIGVSLLDLKPDQCRFIAGDSRDPKPYCGQPVMTEPGPCRYCKFHFRRVYRPRA